MYTVVWYRYPHGIEGEGMDSKWREFDDLNKAMNFLDGRYDRIRGIYWAGGYVEDENGKWVYEINNNGGVFVNGKELR